MNRLFRSRPRAEHFQTLLDGGHRGDLDREHADLLDLVGALRSGPRPEARPEFVADLREQLLLAAQTELKPTLAPSTAARTDTGTARDRDVARLTIEPRRGGRERRVGLALGTLAIMGATTSMAVASQGAIPGDALYPLKRAIENTETGISRGDDAKGEAILGNASGRLDEVGKLTRKGKPDAELITRTLDTFTEQTSQAGDHLLSDYAEHGDPASIEELQSFTHDSVGTLADLEGSVPPEARDALLNAAQTVFALDAIASNACPDCGEPLLELPPQLANGVTTALDETTSALSGVLGGAPSNEQEAASGEDTFGTSGLEPPATPVAVPTVVPTPTAGVPGVDLQPTPAPSTGSGGGGNGGGGNGGDGGKGGKNPTKTPPVELSPVTDTVNEVLTDVLEGVGGVLGGLTGSLLGGGATPPVP